MTLIDTFWNNLNNKCEREQPYRVLLCGANHGDARQEVNTSLLSYKIYDVDEYSVDENIPDLESYDILMMV